MLKIDREENSKYIVFCTQNGLVKRTNIKEFNSIRKNGKIAITLKDDDELIAARKTDETKEVLIASTNGRMIRFNEEEIRIMGRTASGVKGITVGDGKCVVAMNNGLYTHPIPWDEVGCVGNRSTSICNSNSFAGFRYIYGTDIPTGLFVASDGIDESFDESGLNRCYYTLGYWDQTLQKDA